MGYGKFSANFSLIIWTYQTASGGLSNRTNGLSMQLGEFSDLSVANWTAGIFCMPQQYFLNINK
jgi:hypothetical protein